MPTKVPNPNRKSSAAPSYMSIIRSPESSSPSLPMPSFHEQWQYYREIERAQQKQILILIALLVTAVVLAMVIFGI